jgi:hypothetical protein
LTYQPLLTAIMDALLSRPCDGSSENQHRQAIVRALSGCSCDSRAVSALCLLGVFASSRVADDAALGACAHALRNDEQPLFVVNPLTILTPRMRVSQTPWGCFRRAGAPQCG